MPQTKPYTMAISNRQLKEKARHIKWLFTDVDGTLTDGTVYVSPQGEALKRFSLRDGTGFFLLRKAGIKVGIITGENSPIVERRAEKLNVDALLTNAVPKVDTLQNFINEHNLTFEKIAYVGDDLNDIKLLRLCGLSFAVGDADSKVKAVADIVCTKNGGCGAFREVAERLLEMKNINVNYIIEQKL